MRNKPLINGKERHYVSAFLEILGIPIEFTELNYKETQQKTNAYTNAKYATGRSYGKIEPTVSITMSKQMADRLRVLAPERNALHSIPATPLIITYGDAGEPTVTDVIQNFEFLEDGNEGSVNDDFMTTTYACICSHIDYNV